MSMRLSFLRINFLPDDKAMAKKGLSRRGYCCYSDSMGYVDIDEIGEDIRGNLWRYHPMSYNPWICIGSRTDPQRARMFGEMLFLPDNNSLACFLVEQYALNPNLAPEDPKTKEFLEKLTHGSGT